MQTIDEFLQSHRLARCAVWLTAAFVLGAAVGRLVALAAFPHVAAAAPGGYQFNIKPDPTAPGVQGLQHATNKVAMYALILPGIGLLTSMAMLASAKALHLERLHNHGKEGAVISLAVVFAVGIATGILNAAYTL